MTTDYGTDFSTFPPGSSVADLDPSFSTVSGTANVAETLARGLLMPKGRLGAINDSGTAGFYVRRYLAARIDTRVLFEIKTGCDHEARSDERVLSVRTSVTFDQATQKIGIRIIGLTRQGPFELVLNVGRLSTELLIS